MNLPVFFLSFANNALAPLPALEKESESIYRLLTPAAKAQRIQIHREPFASIENTTHYLMQYQHQISVFHYAGHANSTQLILRDQSAFAQGIAQQLAQQKSLKLVFLNGCTTRQQVSLLLDLGIPAVIATSNTINDDTAYKFADFFYTAIAASKSIKLAFETAAANVLTKTGHLPRIYRGTALRSMNHTNKLPWGLYTQEDNSILAQKLIPPSPSPTSEKNVLKNAHLEFDGDVHIGDTNSNSGDNYHKKNIIDGGEIKGKNFTLGDKNSC